MSAEQRQQLLKQWNDWYDVLAVAGKVQSGYPLEPEGRVIVGTRGERVIDGPFIETKETVGGYFFLNVSGLEEATTIAKQCPGLPFGITVEVRPVGESCHLLRSTEQPTAAELAPT